MGTHRPGDHPLGMAGHDEELLLVLGESLLIDSHELGLRLRLAKVSRALGQAQNQKGPGRVGLVGGVKLISPPGRTAAPDQAQHRRQGNLKLKPSHSRLAKLPFAPSP